MWKPKASLPQEHSRSVAEMLSIDCSSPISFADLVFLQAFVVGYEPVRGPCKRQHQDCPSD